MDHELWFITGWKTRYKTRLYYWGQTWVPGGPSWEVYCAACSGALRCSLPNAGGQCRAVWPDLMSIAVGNWSRLRLRGCVHRKFEEAHWQTSAALVYGARSVCDSACFAFSVGGAGCVVRCQVTARWRHISVTLRKETSFHFLSKDISPTRRHRSWRLYEDRQTLQEMI